MKFCKECGAYVDEKHRVNGYLFCSNKHQIEDEFTKAFQDREATAESRLEEKRKLYLGTFPDPEADVSIFRLKNPFDSINHKERAFKISEEMRDLEANYKPSEFRYFRGEALNPLLKNEEKWGVVICLTDLAMDIKNSIESVKLEHGLHYTLEPISLSIQEKSAYIRFLIEEAKIQKA